MKTNAALLVGISLASLCASTACSSSMPQAPRAAARMAQEAPSAPLDRSLFSRDVNGSVSETDLQRILEARMDLTFPARVGVVVLAAPFRAEAGAPLEEQAIIAAETTRALQGSQQYSQVTTVSTDLPNPQGLEGLRTIAARYRLRYLLLCSSKANNQSHLNNWAWLYPTVVGLLFAPGVTVASEGMLQASLFDVKSGTVLFTATEPYQSSSVTWAIGSERHHREVDAEAMQSAAAKLGRQILAQTDHIAEWAKQEKRGGQEARSGQETAVSSR